MLFVHIHSCTYACIRYTRQHGAVFLAGQSVSNAEQTSSSSGEIGEAKTRNLLFDRESILTFIACLVCAE